VLVYDRFWSECEMRPPSPLVESLHHQPSLFRFRATPTESAAHGGPLSLKTVFDGQVVYRFGNREYRVNPSRVLIVPPRSRYATHVGAEGADIATFYFPAQLVAEALNTLTVRDDQLLEGRTVNPNEAMDFPPHHRTISPGMRGVLIGLGETYLTPSLDDIGLSALEMTLRFSLEAKGAIVRLPATRPSVRRELFRRACAARDVIAANPESRLGLPALARASSLSPFHLHRVFRAAFGETPAMMQRRFRVERAQRFLSQTLYPIGDVAHLVGFENESAFSRSFRAVAGVSPRAYRRRDAALMRSGSPGR
jgi:AraC-like DNA-binding protein